MNKRPGQVRVTTEVGYCSFCDRSRNLRREEHVLGSLVRTIVTCESCHRTLSSTMGVAAAEPEPVATAPVVQEAPVEEPKPEPKPAAKKPAAKKPAARKPAAKKTAAKQAATAKSTAKKPAAAVKSKSKATRPAKKK